MDVITKRGRKRGHKYPLLWRYLSEDKIKVGESLFFHANSIKDKLRAQQMAHKIAERNGIKVATRSNADGLMIVRIM